MHAYGFDGKLHEAGHEPATTWKHDAHLFTVQHNVHGRRRMTVQLVVHRDALNRACDLPESTVVGVDRVIGTYWGRLAWLAEGPPKNAERRCRVLRACGCHCEQACRRRR